jgi:hypothetical protein
MGIFNKMFKKLAKKAKAADHLKNLSSENPHDEDDLVTDSGFAKGGGNNKKTRANILN